MAEVEPFRAVRYDERRAGPLASLVAPPYDVITAGERERYLASNPHNVVHLTLPESEEEAARLWREWHAGGVLVQDEEASLWALSQEYVGPDGVARTRTGLAASLRVEPYGRRVVLPHERTHRAPKEGRLRLLRAVRAQLEPILLLHEGEAPFGVPDRAPELAADGVRLWRLAEGNVAEFFADRQLLIADGHHRYETALAYHEAVGTAASAFILAVLVSVRDPGLMIFPTHRVFEHSPNGEWSGPRERNPEAALRALERLPRDEAALVQYTRDRAVVVHAGERGKLDAELVDAFGHEGLSYTPDWREAVRRVDDGEAAVAYLVRPPAVEQVFEHARRGETMPQKTTYFYPKLLSGLLFQPV